MKNYSIVLLIIRTNQVRGEEKRTCCTDKTLIRKTSYSDHEQRFILIGFGAVLKPPGEGPSRSCYCLRFPSSPSRNCQAHFCPQKSLLLVWPKAHRKKKKVENSAEKKSLLHASRWLIHDTGQQRKRTKRVLSTGDLRLCRSSRRENLCLSTQNIELLEILSYPSMEPLIVGKCLSSQLHSMVKTCRDWKKCRQSRDWIRKIRKTTATHTETLFMVRCFCLLYIFFSGERARRRSQAKMNLKICCELFSQTATGFRKCC